MYFICNEAICRGRLCFWATNSNLRANTNCIWYRQCQNELLWQFFFEMRVTSTWTLARQLMWSCRKVVPKHASCLFFTAIAHSWRLEYRPKLRTRCIFCWKTHEITYNQYQYILRSADCINVPTWCILALQVWLCYMFLELELDWINGESQYCTHLAANAWVDLPQGV